MCKIGSGAEIATVGDLQNLITGTILRQNGKFKMSELLECVNESLKGSTYASDTCLTEDLCCKTVRSFSMSGHIRTNKKTLEYRLNVSLPAPFSV